MFLQFPGTNAPKIILLEDMDNQQTLERLENEKTF